MNKQIDEIAKLICTYPQCIHYNSIGECANTECQTVDIAENLYKQGYRKQSEGEWQTRVTGNGWNCWSEFTCSLCGVSFEDEGGEIPTNYCPNCGARMKGE